MPQKAQEITQRLMTRQRAKVAEAEARLADERRKLDLLESLAGDLATVIAEVEGEAQATELKPAMEVPSPKSTPVMPSKKSREGGVALERTLTSQEILEFVDRIGKKFTPSKLKAFVEKQSPIRVALVPLQMALARMAKIEKGVRRVSKGSRWSESAYRALALSESS